MSPARRSNALRAVMRDEWAGGLIRLVGSLARPAAAVGDTLAPIIGARPGEVVVHDSITINLYQLVHAACACAMPDRRCIAVDAGEFPTDRYVVDGIARRPAARSATDSTARRCRRAFARSSTTAAPRSPTSQARPPAPRGRRAAIWDLSHAAGVLDVDLRGRRPAGRRLHLQVPQRWPRLAGLPYVARTLQATQPAADLGLVRQVDQFAMGPTTRPARRRPAAARHAVHPRAGGCGGGIEVTVEAGIDAIAAKARALTGFGLNLCGQIGLESTDTRPDAATTEVTSPSFIPMPGLW